MPQFACQLGDAFINKLIPNYLRGTWKVFPGYWSALQASPYFVLHFHNTQNVSPHQRLMPILMPDPKVDMTTISHNPATKECVRMCMCVYMCIVCTRMHVCVVHAYLHACVCVWWGGLMVFPHASSGPWCRLVRTVEGTRTV